MKKKNANERYQFLASAFSFLSHECYRCISYKHKRSKEREKKFLKCGEKSVLIFTTWLFSKFYKKFSSIKRFSVRFTERAVKYKKSLISIF